MTSPGSPPPPPETGRGALGPTPPRVPVLVAVVGLVLGWLVRPVVERAGATAPLVTWGQPVALLIVAAVLGLAAWLVHRSGHDRSLPPGERLAPHQAVNRLLLARASLLVGALVGGLYAGYALSWIGLDSELADQRALRSGVAALGGVLICLAGLVLERACRIRDDGAEP